MTDIKNTSHQSFVSPANKSLLDIAPHFFQWMQGQGYSQQTLSSWEPRLDLFFRWCRERGVDYPAEVTPAVLEGYQRHLFYYRKQDGKPLGTGTRLNRMVPIRAFFRWMSRKKQLLFNPAADMDLPRQEQRLPSEILSIQEAETILNSVDLAAPLGLRDRAILETLYSTGIRRKECCSLKSKDIDFSRGLLIVRQGKGNKDRIVPIGERAMAWLRKYVWDLRPLLSPDYENHHMFLTREGKPFRPAYLTRLVHQCIQHSGVDKKGSCHIFRHTAATLMLEGGADIRYIQEMLGHSSLTTTQIYTRVAIKKLKEVHTATHPAARLKPSHNKDLENP